MRKMNGNPKTKGKDLISEISFIAWKASNTKNLLRKIVVCPKLAYILFLDTSMKSQIDFFFLQNQHVYVQSGHQSTRRWAL